MVESRNRLAATPSSSGRAEEAPFWQKYLALLRCPKLLVFLAKALIMGVRLTTCLCGGPCV